MTKTIIEYIFFIAVLVFLAIISATQLQCMSAPARDEYDSTECFLSADCLYRNKDNHDKAVCSELIKDCVYTNKEKRIKQRLEYCEKNKFNGMTKNECRLYMNQK